MVFVKTVDNTDSGQKFFVGGIYIDKKRPGDVFLGVEVSTKDGPSVFALVDITTGESQEWAVNDVVAAHKMVGDLELYFHPFQLLENLRIKLEKVSKR